MRGGQGTLCDLLQNELESQGFELFNLRFRINHKFWPIRQHNSVQE